MKRILMYIFPLLVTGSALSQENMFMVYSVKGSVDIVNNKEESKAKIGSLLTNSSVLKLAPGAFATLICNETRVFTLNKAGNYQMSTLKDSCSMKDKGSLSSNYMKYVWNEMTKSQGSPEKNRKAYMNNVGAVSRSINNVWIDPKLDTVNFVSGDIPLSWKSYLDGAEEFEFRLYTEETGGTPTVIRTVKKKHVDMKDLLSNMRPGNSYWWTAMVKGETNDERKYIRYWTQGDYKRFYEGLKLGDASENEAEANFRLAFLLEEAHFLAEAKQHYLKATQLAPDVALYRSTYMSFKKDYEIK